VGFVCYDRLRIKRVVGEEGSFRFAEGRELVPCSCSREDLGGKLEGVKETVADFVGVEQGGGGI
jgi:hypothetical protein